MKKIFRKNQVIITTLAFLIAIAGYISYDKTNGNKESSKNDVAAVNSDVALGENEYDIAMANDTESVETMSTEQEVINPGEAVLTSTIVSNVDYAAEVKLNREQVRSKNKETLNAIIDNASLTEEQKQDAVDQLVAITNTAEMEAEAETLLEAKGFQSVVVSIGEDSCDVVLDMGEVTDAKCAQVEDIVKRKTNISAENIIITPINNQSATEIESLE